MFFSHFEGHHWEITDNNTSKTLVLGSVSDPKVIMCQEITKGDQINHLEKLELVINKYWKVMFGRREIKYPGLWVTYKCLIPVNIKVNAIINMMHPIDKRSICKSIGLVNYYHKI